MAEEVKPPTQPAAKPVAPTKQIVLDVPSGASTADIETELRNKLKEVRSLRAKEANFGPKLPGTTKWQVPQWPGNGNDPRWKIGNLITMNGAGLKRVFVPGQKYDLTYDEIEDLVGRYATRYRQHDRALTGGPPVNMGDLSNGGGTIF